MNASLQYVMPKKINQPFIELTSYQATKPVFRRSLVISGFIVSLVIAFILLIGASVTRAERMPADCSGSGLNISLFADKTTAHAGDTIYYSITVFNGVTGIGPIVCDASNIQAFIITPDGVTNTVALSRTTLHQGDSDSYANAASYVVRSQDVRADGTVITAAKNSGTIHQNDTDSSGGGFQEVSAEIK